MAAQDAHYQCADSEVLAIVRCIERSIRGIEHRSCNRQFCQCPQISSVLPSIVTSVPPNTPNALCPGKLASSTKAKPGPNPHSTRFCRCRRYPCRNANAVVGTKSPANTICTSSCQVTIKAPTGNTTSASGSSKQWTRQIPESQIPTRSHRDFSVGIDC